jgi:hypothetical protein
MVDEEGTIHNITSAHRDAHHKLTRIMSQTVRPEALEGIA